MYNCDRQEFCGIWSSAIFRLAWIAFAIALLFALPLRAAELLMFEEHRCPWCAQWNEDVGVVYHKTDEGRRAPLRRVDIHSRFPEGITLASRPRYSPTFVLIDDGQEVGRIEGYPGEDFFWGLLGKLLSKL